jgi:hypothetical protein
LIPVEGGCSDYQDIEKIYGMLSVHMHIPFPENLPSDLLVRKMRQLDWLMKANHLSVKLKDEGSILPKIKVNKETDAEEED